MDHTPLGRDTVAGGFDEAARHYDLMVALNPGYRRHLRAAAEALLAGVRGVEPVLYDLGCGSGLSTRALLDACEDRGLRPRIIGVDASAGMLEHARRRDWPDGVEFVHARSEEMDALGLPPADGVLACYLLRNTPDLDSTLRHIADALRSGAPFVAEDYSVRASASAQRRWTAVNRGIILPLARVLTGDAALYEYLHRSVDDFCTMPELAARLHAVGFVDVASRTVGGWQRDILHIVRARRTTAL